MDTRRIHGTVLSHTRKSDRKSNYYMGNSILCIKGAKNAVTNECEKLPPEQSGGNHTHHDHLPDLMHNTIFFISSAAKWCCYMHKNASGKYIARLLLFSLWAYFPPEDSLFRPKAENCYLPPDLRACNSILSVQVGQTINNINNCFKIYMQFGGNNFTFSFVILMRYKYAFYGFVFVIIWICCRLRRSY